MKKFHTFIMKKRTAFLVVSVLGLLAIILFSDLWAGNNVIISVQNGGLIAAQQSTTSVPSGPSFDYDIWLDFESNSDCTDAELEKTDNTASSIVYDEFDPDEDLLCTQNTSVKNGSYAASYDFTAGKMAFISNTSVTSPLSGAGWFYLPEFSTTFRGNRVIEIRTSSYQIIGYIGWTKGGSGEEYLEFLGTTSLRINNLPSNAWYWIAYNFKINSASYLAVFDSTGVMQTPSLTNSLGVATLASWVLGGTNPLNSNPVSFYFDDICLDWSSARWTDGVDDTTGNILMQPY